MAVRCCDYVKVEESDWTDNFDLTENGNPKFSMEMKYKLSAVSQSSVKSGGLRNFFPSSYLSLSDVRHLCAWTWRTLLVTHLSGHQDKYMETSSHGSSVHRVVYRAELDSENGSLYCRGLN